MKLLERVCVSVYFWCLYIVICTHDLFAVCTVILYLCICVFLHYICVCMFSLCVYVSF